MLLRRPQVSKQNGSSGQSASAVGPGGVLRSFGLPTFQLGLAEHCSLCGIGSRLQAALLEEVAPSLMPIAWTLVAFELLQSRLCIGPSLDDLDHTRRLISADVVPYDNVGSLKFVVCQTLSLFRCNKTPCC